MKKLLVILFAFVLFVPSVLFAEGNNKVKVYVFEAGGCPYCELELEYLKGLSSYKTKFEIVTKELYVDHVDWKEGKDYKLGVSVATAFNEAGFEDAAYTGTPFVVISDTYAVAGYSQDLEDIIDAAYDEGDKDAVSCIAAGNDNCIRAINTETLSSTAKSSINKKPSVAIAILGVVALIGAVIYIVKNRNTEAVEAEKVEKEKVEEEKPIKKTTPAKKKAPAKTVTKKTTTTKTVTKKTNKK